MEISQLRYFLEVAERLNFTRAGDELGVSQPALSRSIARLETELGQPLFDRQGRQLAFTDAGKMFQARAEQIVALVDDSLAALTDNGQTGRVRVGAIPTIAPYFLPGVLRLFRDRHPQASVTAIEETTARLIHRCQHGEVDVALLAAPIAAQHLESESLFDEPLWLVLPAGHELAGRPAITLADVRTYPFVLLDETHCLSDTVVSFCRQRSFEPLTVQHTSQLATVEELVALGHGVSLIPEMARQVDTSARRVYRSLTEPQPRRQIVMVWNPYRFQSQLAERFKDCVRSAASRCILDRDGTTAVCPQTYR
jgi:LysR family hydrogen peroxide-inducible transcriptional activator